MPNTDCVGLKVVVIALSALWVFLGVRLMVNSGGPLSLLFGIALVVLAVGLWRLHPLARSGSKLALGSIVVLDIVGTFGPFFGFDHPAAGYGSEIPWVTVFATHIPIVALGLLLFWLLDRYKHNFNPQGPSGNSDAA